ncbi:LOG family protein [Spathaspora sp. JA1]|nr:LOG family protein [Spathaspora sp. JA1]
MSSPVTKLCVFCGSSSGKDPSFAIQAKQLGNAIAEKKWGLVYGGGSTGLMGEVANGCASKGGYVHGIIPEALISRERTEVDVKKSIDNHNGLTPIPDSKEYGHTTLVKDMHTRKRLMGQEADAFVALPGGYGTLEELMEVVTWQQLNIHNKPIVIFNINGFFDSFLKFIQVSIDSEFVSVKNGDIIKVANTVEEVLKAVEEYQVPEGRFNLKWDNNDSTTYNNI